MFKKTGLLTVLAATLFTFAYANDNENVPGDAPDKEVSTGDVEVSGNDGTVSSGDEAPAPSFQKNGCNCGEKGKKK